jgi:hypothetical protein
MKVEIQGDDFFKIEVNPFGEKYVASDEERVAIEKTPEEAVESVVEMQQHTIKAKNAAPIQNAKGLGWFDGTSWGTK